MPAKRVRLAAALLTVVFVSMNAARLLIGFVVQVNAFAPGHHAIGPGALFDAIQVDLAGGEAPGLGARELATRDAQVDPLALVLARTTARTRWR